MTVGSTSSWWYRGFRITVFALLVGNTAYYFYAGTLSKGLDAAAWLLLLALYMQEMGGQVHGPRIAIAVNGARLIAAAGICLAGAFYVIERNSLDAINTSLWIGVVLLLELEVRRPRDVARRRALYTAAAVLLYSGLAMLVLAWSWRGEWLDAYDALLWLIAFAGIEMDLIRPRQAA